MHQFKRWHWCLHEKLITQIKSKQCWLKSKNQFILFKLASFEELLTTYTNNLLKKRTWLMEYLNFFNEQQFMDVPEFYTNIKKTHITITNTTQLIDVIKCWEFCLDRPEEVVSCPPNVDEAVCGYSHSVQLLLAATHPLRFHCIFSTFVSLLESCLLFQLHVSQWPTASNSINWKKISSK